MLPCALAAVCSLFLAVADDPNAVVREMFAASRSHAAHYEFDLVTTGSLRSEVREAAGNVAVQTAPYRVRIEASRRAMPGETAAPGAMTLASDGANIALLDPGRKTLFKTAAHRAGSLLVKSRTMYPAYPWFNEAWLREQTANNVFRSDGSANLDGLECDVVHVDSGEQRIELAVARRDRLPRRVRWISLRQDKPGDATLTIRNLKPSAPLRGKDLTIDAPAGFERAEYTFGGPEVGALAPDFLLATSAGQFTAANTRGKIVVLDFWATWCGPCRASMPALQRLHHRFRERGVVVLGATWSDDGDAAAFARENGITYPHGKGDGFARAWGIGNSGVPTMFVIDRDGRIADYFIGWDGEATRALLRSRIEALLAKK